MNTKILFLLDRNVISVIKDAVNDKALNDLNKVAMLDKLKEIDKTTSAISCILSLIEGQKGRDESPQEKIECLRKETDVIKKFFRFASTDSATLQSTETSFSDTFTEYREEDWVLHNAFLIDVCPLLNNKVSESARDDIKNKLISSAQKKGLYLGHIIVVACLSCLYGSDAARAVLKPHKAAGNYYNALNDLFVLSRVNLIKAISQSQGLVDLNIEFLTLDKNLKTFLSGVYVRKTALTSCGVSQTVEYSNQLFPSLNEEQYHLLLSEIC